MNINNIFQAHWLWIPPLDVASLFFMTALLLAGVMTSSWTLTRSWNRAVEDMERNAINLSVSQARQAEDTVLQTELALRDIRRTIPADSISTLNAGRFDVLLAELKERLPQLHGLFIYDAQGNMKATALAGSRWSPTAATANILTIISVTGINNIHIGRVISSRSTGDLVIPYPCVSAISAGGFCWRSARHHPGRLLPSLL